MNTIRRCAHLCLRTSLDSGKCMSSVAASTFKVSFRKFYVLLNSVESKVKQGKHYCLPGHVLLCGIVLELDPFMSLSDNQHSTKYCQHHMRSDGIFGASSVIQ